MTGIYGIRNDKNGKWYIGQAKDIGKRNKNEKRNIKRGYIHPNASANKNLRWIYMGMGNGS